MASGKSVLRKFDRAISGLKADALAAEAAHDSARQEIANSRRKIASHLSVIARTQAEAIQSEAIAAYDMDTTRVALALMVREDEERAALGSLEAYRNTHDKIEQREADALAVVDAHEAEVRAIRDSAVDALRDDRAHQALLKALEKAGEVAAAAAERALTARDERDTKVAAYRNDPLFAYLLHRRFGTPGYKAGAVTRTIDSWVARLCNFTAGHRDLQVLEQLPRYLAANAERMEKAHEDADKAVQQSLRAAMKERGVDAAEAMLAESQRVLGVAQAETEASGVELERLEAGYQQYVSWSDTYSRRIDRLLTESMAKESTEELLQRAARTASAADDEAAKEIGILKRRITEIEGDLPSLAASAERYKQQLDGLKAVRTKYKREGFDDSDYEFPERKMEGFLEGYLAGSIASGDLWKSVKRSAHYDPPASYTSSSSYRSSGGFGSLSGGFGSGGSFGGGGFSSGGGFGGGGFSTGGGF